MKFHHDSVMDHRLTREPYFPLDAMCTIHYLTDVTEKTPSFAVVPRSSRARTLAAHADADPSSARLVAIYAPRGSMVLYDNATWHTRLDGSAEPSLTVQSEHPLFCCLFVRCRTVSCYHSLTQLILTFILRAPTATHDARVLCERRVVQNTARRHAGSYTCAGASSTNLCIQLVSEYQHQSLARIHRPNGTPI